MTFLDHKGFYKCGKCKPCQLMGGIRKINEFQSMFTMLKYKIDKLITCCSRHVTYILECGCGLQYVGRTTRKLSVRIGENISNIKKGFRHHSLSLNFRAHNRDPLQLKFYAIYKVDQNWRNLNLRREISRNDTYWIFLLNTLCI